MDLETRVARLERSTRLWRLAAVALGLALLARSPGVVVAQDPKHVRAQKLTLEDASGKVCAELRLKDGKTPVLVFEEGGKPRVVLGLGEGGASGLTLLDEKTQIRGVLGLGADGEAGLALNDPQGRLRTAIVSRASGLPAIVLRDEVRTRLAVGQSPADEVAFVVNDRAGKTRAVFGMQGGAAALTLRDADEKPRAGIHLDASGAPRLELLDGEGKKLYARP